MQYVFFLAVIALAAYIGMLANEGYALHSIGGPVDTFVVNWIAPIVERYTLGSTTMP